MKIAFKIFMICFLMFSCKETKKEKSENSGGKEILVEEKKDSVAAKKEITANTNDDVKIKFPDLTISIKGVDMNWKDDYNPNDNVYEAKIDTAYFDLNPGDWFYEKSFVIEEPEFDQIELYAQFEVNVAITTNREIEVPMCIIEDWKCYTSKWTKYKVDRKDLKFPIIEENKDNIIDFTIEELKLAVGKHCGSEWLSEIRNIQSRDKLPTSFFVTKYIFKIKARNSKTNQVIEKFIVFYTPTSC